MNEAPVENGFFRWVRTLGVNRSEHGWIGGVAAGIGARFGIDPILARGIVIVLTLFGGFGITVYGLAWALLPAHDGRIHLQEAARGRWASGMTGALIFFVFGTIGEPWGAGWWGWGNGWGWVWPVAAVGLVLWLLFARDSTDQQEQGSTVGSRFKAAFTQQGTAQHPYSATGSASASTGGPSATGTIVPPPEEANPMNDTTPTDPPSGAEPGPISLDKPAASTQDFGRGFESGFDSGSYSYQAPYVPAPPEPRAPQTPRAHPLPGYQGAIVLGIAALVAGAILALENLNVISIGTGTVAVALAAALVVIGIGVIGAAMRRQTGGVLIGLGIPVLVLSLVFGGGSLAANSRPAWLGGITDQSGNTYTFVFHSGDLDLTGFADITRDTTVKVDNVFSNLDIAVPGNIPVQVDYSGAFTRVDLVSTGGSSRSPGGSGALNPGATGPTLTIELDGAFNNVTVTSQEAVVTP